MLSEDGIIRSVADAERIGLACESLVWILGDDPRVQLAYVQWRLKPGTPPELLASLDRLVRDHLRLPYPWLGQLLAADFVSHAVSESTGDSRRISVTASDEMRTLVPPGRRAKLEGQHIFRDVDWFYRTEVKQPRESVRSVAKRYGEEVVDGQPRSRTWSKGTGGRSQVQNAVKRVKLLLAAPDVDRSPLVI